MFAAPRHFPGGYEGQQPPSAAARTAMITATCWAVPSSARFGKTSPGWVPRRSGRPEHWLHQIVRIAPLNRHPSLAAPGRTLPVLFLGRLGRFVDPGWSTPPGDMPMGPAAGGLRRRTGSSGTPTEPAATARRTPCQQGVRHRADRGTADKAISSAEHGCQSIRGRRRHRPSGLLRVIPG